jgi:NADPH-dependent curcumin reductase CurA
MATEIHLVARPVGLPRLDDFAVVDGVDPRPGDGEALVRSDYVSVDPGQRSRMRDADAPVGRAVPGSSLGTVVASRSAQLPEGALVRGRWGWRELAVVRPEEVDVVPEEPGIARTSELSVLGTPGLTAFVGFHDIGRPRPGEVVFVSGAAGAIGSMVGQMAKLAGCTVIGSAGGPAKVAHLLALGFDHAIDYRATPPGDALGTLAPDGIDLAFDNVGGEHLQAAVDHLRDHGRIVSCGSVSAYNDDGPGPALRNLRRFVTHRLRMEGFVIWDHAHRREAHRSTVLDWLRAGRLQDPISLTVGLQRAPEAFISMLQGGNIGKALVQVR